MRKRTLQLASILITTSLFAVFVRVNPSLAQSEDPFASIKTEGSPTLPALTIQEPSFFKDNFTFKKELYSQFSYGPNAHNHRSYDELYSRQSVGFEILKKFSTATSTFGSVDFQGRLVRRDEFIPVLNDEEGSERDGWFAEYHNAYLDLYNIFNPLLSDAQTGPAAGHFNFRLGRFYLPLGINLQTDTHGTLLQLSNERNLGFERDWHAGFWGSINPQLNYDLYYLLGSGYDPSFDGQNGMLGSRVSLSNTYLNDYGVEGGVSLLVGQRKSKHAIERSMTVASEATNGEFIDTSRYGADARYTHLIPTGSLTGTGEVSLGQDESEGIFTQLYQLDYLNRSRKWSISSQYRRFHQDRAEMSHGGDGQLDSSIIAELTWFFRNDIGNTNLHWIKLNVERQLERMEGPTGTVTTLQYYRYW